MKAALALLFVALSIAVANAALTCRMEKEKCTEDQCCVKFGALGTCKPLKGIDERCEVHPGKHLIQNHVYMVMCECAPGLKCVAKDGLVGKLLGTCQEDSGENPEE